VATAHPVCCVGHACDRCAICLSGTCCGSVARAPSAAAVQTDPAAADRLREAIAEEVQVSVNLAQLIKTDLEARTSGAPAPKALPPGAPTTKIIINSDEEVEHVQAPHPPR
jgi:hypothetical protein